MTTKINIRPGVSILSVLRHLNYKPWYALAEFVDNSIDSFLKENEKIKSLEGKNTQLKVYIDLLTADKKIVIVDNAAGIHNSEFDRAFRAAEIPPDTTGLSEFGMGMKSASCWFTNTWEVRTKSISDEKEYLIKFDIEKIIEDKLEELEVTTQNMDKNKHYTRIILRDVHNFPTKKTVGKIKQHLASIYRYFIRKGILILYVNDEKLTYSEPEILNIPYFKDEKKTKKIEWKKNINIVIDGITVTGFAALRETGSTSEAGFALFRKGRVIEGSGDEGFRPESIFLSSNSYTYQRLFGELFLDGVGVSHTKDGIQWQEYLEPFLLELKKQLNEEPIPLLSQAEGYRKRPKNTEITVAGNRSLSDAVNAIKNNIPQFLSETKNHEIINDDLFIEEKLPENSNSVFKVVPIEFENETWNIHVELSYEDKDVDWLQISDSYIKEEFKTKNNRELGIKLSLINPFMQRFAGVDENKIQPILRIAAALAISETVARDSGICGVHEVRRNVNELLGGALSKP